MINLPKVLKNDLITDVGSQVTLTHGVAANAAVLRLRENDRINFYTPQRRRVDKNISCRNARRCVPGSVFDFNAIHLIDILE